MCGREDQPPVGANQPEITIKGGRGWAGGAGVQEVRGGEGGAGGAGVQEGQILTFRSPMRLNEVASRRRV